METRRFGRTGHMSTVAILGGFAFSAADQAETDAMMERVIAAGVNPYRYCPIVWARRRADRPLDGSGA
jgi:hypothetical protein